MSDTSPSRSQSRWKGKYHVVFGPKRRRKRLYGTSRKTLGPLFHARARQKDCRIREGHWRPDQVHIGIASPPKQSVASVSGCLKGQSAIARARQLSGRDRNFTGEHVWARR